MLNVRAKTMCSAPDETKEGKEDLGEILTRSTQCGFHRLATMIWTTIGYAMVAGLIGIAYMDQVLAAI